MAVNYRYRSGVETFSVPVAAPSISVAELKQLILGTTRHGHGRTRGRGPREAIALSNAQTGEEYADGTALVPRNSTVVVRRVAGPPAETIVLASSDSAGSGSTTGAAEEDESKSISAVIDAAQLTSAEPLCYGRRGAAHAGGRAPPAGYVCHRCRVPGHFIQHCPTNGDPRFDYGRTTATAAAPPVLAPVTASTGAIPEELHCKICSKVMADAVMTSKCCFTSFCDGCIRGHIIAKSSCVCGARARADDLIPNPALRTTIANLLAAEKQRSSPDSDAAAEPAHQSPAAASQESRQSHDSSKKAEASEQSDGSGSTTSKNAAAPAAHGPEQETSGVRAEHYGVPFGAACYGGMMPYPGIYYGGGMPYPMPGPHHVDFSSSYGFHGEDRGRKRTRASEHQSHDEQSLKRWCGGSRSQLAV